MRASGSGDGCPDWPQCFGRWHPPLEFEAIVEYSHRYSGAIAITLLLVTTGLIIAKHRDDRRLLVPAIVASFGILGQAGLGGFVVWVKEQAKTVPAWRGVEGSLVTFHITTAMMLIGALVLISVRTNRLARLEAGRPDFESAPEKTRKFALYAAGAVFVQIMLGAYTRGSHAGLAFPDFPLMDGTMLPSLAGVKGIHFAHRVFAVVVGTLVIAFAVHVTRMAKRTRNKVLMPWAHAAATLVVAQMIIGGLQVTTRLEVIPVALHVLLAALIWSTLVAVIALSRPLAPRGSNLRSLGLEPREPVPVPIAGGQVDLMPAPPVTFKMRAAAYLALTKPRIIVLLLITTVPAMVLAADGWPGTTLVLLTLIGGTLGAGSANAINMVIDQDIDALMSRTRRRPIPNLDVTPGRALTFAMSLAAISFVLLVITTNLLSAILVQCAIAFYVFVYTLWLKRSTPQNIVIGGAAGAVPALVGWAAVTNSLSLEAWLLFAIIFAWTPAHFWALAIRFASDYKAAGVPMLPVVAGRERTQRAILGYTLVTVLLTAGLWAVADLGWIYAITAAGAGLWFLRDAVRLWKTDQVTSVLAMTVFKTSILYLALVFGAVAADVLV